MNRDLLNQIYATVGNEEKVQYLMEDFGIPPESYLQLKERFVLFRPYEGNQWTRGGYCFEFPSR